MNVTVEDSIGTIWLDHPERRNAISSEMWVGLTAAAAQVDADPQVRVIVLRGAGTEAFASGADISQFGERRSGSDANAGYDRTTGAAYQSLAGASKPVLALIHGFCIGGGLAVALSADLRLAADDATFAIPAARLGLGYGAGGIQNLMQLVGPSATRRILFTAQRFDAVEALRIGLVDEVVPKAELDGRVEELAATIAANAPLDCARRQARRAGAAGVSRTARSRRGRGRRAVLLRQPGLPGGRPRLHGEAPAGVQGRLRRRRPGQRAPEGRRRRGRRIVLSR